MSSLRVMSTVAVRAAYLDLVTSFEKQSGQQVETRWVGMADIRSRVEAGEAVDAVIASAALVDTLVKGGHLRARIDLARSQVGAAVRPGATKPDLSSVEGFKRALLEARSIVYSSGPSGVYLAELFQRLGLADALRDKARQLPPGVLVAEEVARGNAELAFQQIPELRQVQGIDYAGPLPRELQVTTVFSGAVHARSAAAQAAQAFLDYLASPERAAVKRQHGFDA